MTPRYSGRVPDYQQHPELTEAYPSLEQTVLTTGYSPPGTSGSYISPRPGDRTDAEVIDIDLDRTDLEEQKDILLHEQQHAIQTREGWAPGASVEQWEKVSRTINDDLTRAEDRLFTARKKVREFEAQGISEDAIGMRDARWRLEEAEARHKQVSDEFDFFFRNARGNPERAYYLEAGEAEARLTENRSDLTLEERIEEPPWVTTEEYRQRLPEVESEEYASKMWPRESEVHVARPGRKIFEGRTKDEPIDDIPKYDSTSGSPTRSFNRSANERFAEIMDEIDYRFITPFITPARQLSEGGQRVLLDTLAGITSGALGALGHSLSDDDPLVRLGLFEEDPEKREKQIEEARENLRNQGAETYPMDENEYARRLSSGIRTLIDKIAPTVGEAQKRIMQSEAYQRIAPYVIQGWESIPEKERRSMGGVAEIIGSTI